MASSLDEVEQSPRAAAARILSGLYLLEPDNTIAEEGGLNEDSGEEETCGATSMRSEIAGQTAESIALDAILDVAMHGPASMGSCEEVELPHHLHVKLTLAELSGSRRESRSSLLSPDRASAGCTGVFNPDDNNLGLERFTDVYSASMQEQLRVARAEAAAARQVLVEAERRAHAAHERMERECARSWKSAKRAAQELRESKATARKAAMRAEAELLASRAEAERRLKQSEAKWQAAEAEAQALRVKLEENSSRARVAVEMELKNAQALAATQAEELSKLQASLAEHETRTNAEQADLLGRCDELTRELQAMKRDEAGRMRLMRQLEHNHQEETKQYAQHIRSLEIEQLHSRMLLGLHSSEAQVSMQVLQAELRAAEGQLFKQKPMRRGSLEPPTSTVQRLAPVTRLPSSCTLPSRSSVSEYVHVAIDLMDFVVEEANNSQTRLDGRGQQRLLASPVTREEPSLEALTAELGLSVESTVTELLPSSKAVSPAPVLITASSPFRRKKPRAPSTPSSDSSTEAALRVLRPVLDDPALGGREGSSIATKARFKSCFSQSGSSARLRSTCDTEGHGSTLQLSIAVEKEDESSRSAAAKGAMWNSSRKIVNVEKERSKPKGLRAVSRRQANRDDQQGISALGWGWFGGSSQKRRSSKSCEGTSKSSASQGTSKSSASQGTSKSSASQGSIENANPQKNSNSQDRMLEIRSWDPSSRDNKSRSSLSSKERGTNGWSSNKVQPSLQVSTGGNEIDVMGGSYQYSCHGTGTPSMWSRDASKPPPTPVLHRELRLIGGTLAKKARHSSAQELAMKPISKTGMIYRF